MPEGLPAAGAERERGLFLFRAGGLHDGDQFARDEGESDEQRGQHHAGHGENDPDVVLGQPAVLVVQPMAEPALRTEKQDKDEAGHDRRDGEGQINERDQEGLAAKLELGDGPGGGDAEDEVERHADGRDEQGEPNRGERVRLGERTQIEPDARGERLIEDVDQRQQKKKQGKGERDGGEEPFHEPRFLGTPAVCRFGGAVPG